MDADEGAGRASGGGVTVDAEGAGQPSRAGKPSRPPRRLQGLPWVCLALAVWLGVFSLYERGRPRLAAGTPGQRLQQLASLAGSARYSHPATRAAVAGLREFFLDYPGERAPRLEVQLALTMMEEPDADWPFIARTIQDAAAGVLARLPPGRDPQPGDFQPAGLEFQAYSAYFNSPDGWPPPFLLADVDGDGKRDLVFVCPGAGAPGVGCLFRRVPARQGTGGWAAYPFSLGLPVIGLASFPITRRGPEALVLASLVDQAYEPNLLFDVFVWQGGRLNNVLSTTIPNGWQWDHRDLDGDGREEIRLFGRDVRVSTWEHQGPFRIATYRWDGRRFVLVGTTRKPAKQPAGQADVFYLRQEGQRLMDAGRYQEAVRVFEAATPASEAWLTCYYLGICHGMLGHAPEAAAQMRRSVELAGAPPPNEDGSGVQRQARRFLHTYREPASLQRALASAGQGFRALETLLASAAPDASSRKLVERVYPPLGGYQELDLTGDGQPEAVTRLAWPGGSAVVALQREPHSGRWTLWPLAYGLADAKPPTESDPFRPADLFYLPRGPAVSRSPAAGVGGLVGIHRAAGGPPEVLVQLIGADGVEQVPVRWDGTRFSVAGPLSTGGRGDFTTELAALEARLFERREYGTTLARLDDLAAAVRAGSGSAAMKRDLLLEIFYHQAVCRRKLGRTRAAEVTLAGLSRGYPETAWGRLARLRLGE
jgi:hypothetical protein